MPRTATMNSGAGWARARVLGAALACAALAMPLTVPAAAAGAMDPEDQKKTVSQPKKSSGPRKMGLGGVRAKGAKEMEKLGGAKIPIKSVPKAMRHPRYQLGGARARAPRRIGGTTEPYVPAITSSAPERSLPLRPTPAITVDQFRAALLSGGDRVRHSAFERAVRQSGFGDDLEVGPRIRIRGGGPEAGSSAGLRPELRELILRSTRDAAGAAVLDAMMTPAQGREALNRARREFGERGYTEVNLGGGEVGFVRTSNQATLESFRNIGPRVRTAADRNEIEAWWSVRRRFNCRNCDDLDPSRMMYVEEGGGVDPRIQFGSATPPVEEIPEPGFDAAVVALEDGRYADAASELETYLQNDPEDTEIIRLLGFVQLLDGQTAAGIETIGVAYETDPYLAARPIGPDLVTDRPGDLRRALSAAVGHAHRTNAPRAWLAAAVLMNAEGRPEQAMKMLERGVASGLSGAVADEMLLALQP